MHMEISNKRIVSLISCSKAKRSYPCEARLLYDESTLFKKSLAYAQTISTDADIYVLSSKYGLVPLDEKIAPYDETLNVKSASELADWSKRTAAQIQERYDVQNVEFEILAGRSYYAPLQPYLSNIRLPLRGLSIGERLSKLDKLIGMSTVEQPSVCFRLHKLFNNMPRYRWDLINKVSFNDGIYIVFEDGETYHNMDRIVRVGTHKSDGRLRMRLKNHLVDENKDGSIFRKNIGRAILNKNHSPYLKVWNVDTSKKDKRESLEGYNAIYQKKIEAAISAYMREHIFFVCFPVVSQAERLRLEEGIIATLSTSSDFTASPNWHGRYSPEAEIVQSGLWLKQGLDGIPLSESEYETITSYCSATSQPQSEGKMSAVSNKPIENSKVTSTAKIAQYIENKLVQAKSIGLTSVTITSGSVHKELGLVSRMPMVCGAMRKIMKDNDVIHYAPPSGNGSTLRIEYFI